MTRDSKGRFKRAPRRTTKANPLFGLIGGKKKRRRTGTTAKARYARRETVGEHYALQREKREHTKAIAEVDKRCNAELRRVNAAYREKREQLERDLAEARAKAREGYQRGRRERIDEDFFAGTSFATPKRGNLLHLPRRNPRNRRRSA